MTRTLDGLYCRYYYWLMTRAVKRTISVPAEVFTAVEAEVADRESVSTFFSEGARLLLRRRAAERGIAQYESEHGRLTQDELAEADRLLDAVNQRRRR